MKGIINYLMKFLFVLTFLLSMQIFAPVIADETLGERINVSANEIMITENGIFLLTSDDALPLTAVYADAEGLYIRPLVKVDRIYDTCPNGHKIYHSCGGCANWWCNFRCKCHSPWE